jgi:hypothetical protein
MTIKFLLSHEPEGARIVRVAMLAEDGFHTTEAADLVNVKTRGRSMLASARID